MREQRVSADLAVGQVQRAGQLVASGAREIELLGSQSAALPLTWCGRWESNPHSRYGKRILSPQRLPFRHVRFASHGDGSASRGYSAVTSFKFKRSRISFPGLK